MGDFPLIDHFRNRSPRDLLDFNVFGSIQLLCLTKPRIQGKECVAQIVLYGRVGMHSSEELDPFRFIAGFFQEFSPCGVLGGLVLWIHHAARDFPDKRGGTVPELPDQDDVPFRCYRHDIDPVRGIQYEEPMFFPCTGGPTYVLTKAVDGEREKNLGVEQRPGTQRGVLFRISFRALLRQFSSARGSVSSELHFPNVLSSGR